MTFNEKQLYAELVNDICADVPKYDKLAVFLYDFLSKKVKSWCYNDSILRGGRHYEDIIKYVMANKVDNETLDLLSKVNGHIRNCESCRELVFSYERINDELKKEKLKKDLDLNHFDDLIKENNNIENEYY